MPEDRDQIDCSVRIVTPENISFLYEVAGPFRRLPGFLIDLTIRFGLAFAALFVCGLLGMVTGALAFGPLLLSWFVLEWFYGGLFETFWNGQTPGKRVTGIRVLGVDGKPVNGLQAVLRNILRAVDQMPVVPVVALGVPDVPLAVPTFMTGLIASALNHRYQRLGDLVCGTMVVVERRGAMLGLAKLEDPRAAQLAAGLPAGFLVDASLSRALSTYVERRGSLLPPRRGEIARRLADPLLEAFQFPPDTNPDLLLCALYYRTYIADQDQADELVGDAVPEELVEPTTAEVVSDTDVMIIHRDSS